MFRESFLFAFGSVTVNKLRTFLSLFGITIGIVSIISVFTVFDWMENSIRDSIASLGDNTIYVEKWQIVRALKDGVQVGPTRKESLGKRDCTTWFMARINPTTGLPVALAIAKGKGSWAAAGWNNSAPPTE